MPPEVHSVLGASAADRWMNCTPSAQLTAGMEDEPTTFAAEGTAAHALCEWKVRKALKMRAGRRPTSDYWTDEMEEFTDDYRDFIMDLVDQAKQHCKDPVTLIEQHLDFSCYVPDGFGTGDFLLVADKELNVVDFKYGRGVAVYADHNPQMMLYALGALNLFYCLYDIEQVTYQMVKMIERGQQDDRIALIEAGRKEIMLALTLQDENDRNEQMRLGIHNLLLGREQIGKAMVRRIEDFEPLSESRVVLFLNTLAHNNYQNKKDDEIENIQECYEMYLQATKMIAGAYAYKGEMAAVEQTFVDGISFLDSIDFGKLKSIELAHKGVNLDDMFYNHASQYVEIEKKQCVESGKSYDYVALEVTGDKLLEVLSDGGEVSKEKAK